MWKDNNIMSSNKGTFEKVSLGTLDNPNIGVLSHKYNLVPADFLPSSHVVKATRCLGSDELVYKNRL